MENNAPPAAGRSDTGLPADGPVRRLSGLSRITLAVAMCIVAGCVILVLLPVLAGPGGGPVQTAASPPVDAPAVTAEPSATATEPQASGFLPPLPAGPPAAPPQRLVYPAAGIDVVIHPLEPTGADQASQTIVPPPTMDGYWLTPFGVPGAGSVNTTYVAGHSWVDQDAPFNGLSTRAAPGDRLTVTTSTGVVAYRVDSVTTYAKSGLKDSPIWQVVPNRLVLISCYTDDFWGTNVVVVASPDAASQ
ncbi:class F sortase [Arthrobacter sp. BE255]|uniref:class F sortase n=1 Tax=Arthrobacter sp. BE255 TaxID=2817721 RepID=UPI00286D37DE|nr:class F sortase [Arthrobacter sp. BE255]